MPLGRPERALRGVADGMGGRALGGFASRLASADEVVNNVTLQTEKRPKLRRQRYDQRWRRAMSRFCAF